MHQVLREHAIILRSQADELDAIADALQRAENPGAITDTMGSYEPRVDAVPIIDPDDNSSSGLTVAEADGRVDVTYQNIGIHNEDVVLRMAKHDALQGKVVFLDYGDLDRNQIWTKETFA